MARRVLLHVGTPKSGTTYLQTLMWRHRRELAGQGFLFAGDRFADRYWATLEIRGQPVPGHLPPAARTAWRRIVRRAADFSGDVVISHEFFGAATSEQARRAIDDLRPADVHVVVTARPFVRAVPTMWQESLKFGNRHTLASFTAQWVSGAPLGSWGRHTGDPADVLDRWCKDLAADRGHVIVVSPRPDRPDELWHLFADLCGLDPASVDVSSNRPNSSVSVESAELLRRINPHIRAPIVGPRETPVWIRDELTHRVLSSLPGHGIGLSAELVGQVSELSAQCVDRIRSAGWQVSGDLDLLLLRAFDRLLSPAEVPDAVLADRAAASIALMLARQRERAIELGRLEREVAVTEAAVARQRREIEGVRTAMRRSVTSLNAERLRRVVPAAGEAGRRLMHRVGQRLRTGA